MEQEKISLHGESTFVLIHGAWGCSSVWDQVELYLRRLGHRTVAVDLPGHGRDRSDIRLQSTKTYTEKVKRVIEEIVEPVILVGHSMGGSVISAVGEAVPERVEKLVYCAAFLLDYGESGNGTDGSGIQPVDWYPYSDDGKSVSWEAYQRQNPTSMGNARYVSAEDLVREEKVMKGARESIAAL